MIDKLNAFFGRFVGPNAAHTIDGLIGVALVGVPTLTASHAARVFLLHHSMLGMIVTAALPVTISLGSKFRKAAGNNASLADDLAAAVRQAVADAHAPSAPVAGSEQK